jgi:hypothetical protein
VELSHYVALLSKFCDLECFSSHSFINICTYYVIYGANICTFVENNIDLSEKILGNCSKPVITSLALLCPLYLPANHINDCVMCNFLIGRGIAIGGAYCIDYICCHVCLHACNSLIGPRFAQFSTNVNSMNCDINLYISFLGIVRHFVLDKFAPLQPVIASWCVNNFDIFLYSL